MQAFFKVVQDIFEKQYLNLLRGIGWTMLIALVGTIVGLLIGLILGVIRTVPEPNGKAGKVCMKIVNFIINAYIEIFRGTPMMVQAMVIYWGYAYANQGSTMPLLFAGLFIVSINTGAYMAEIVRGGIMSIDKGQFEGASSLGMTHFQTMFHVVIPQALRNIMPSVANEFVINIKDTSVLNVIGVTELYFYTGIIYRQNWQYFPTYLLTCIIYFILTFSITRILRLIEKKMNGKKNYTICGSQSSFEAEIHVKEQEETL